MPRPKKPDNAAFQRPLTIPPVRLDGDSRIDLIERAGLPQNTKRSNDFIRDIEEILTQYRIRTEKSKNQPSAGSQKRVFTEMKKRAWQLQSLMVSMDSITKVTYNMSFPKPLYHRVENLWQDDYLAVDQIIRVAERGEAILSRDVQPGKRKNIALEDMILCLTVTMTRYNRSIGKRRMGQFVQTVCESANITIPDLDHSPSRFWSLVDPPFPPKH